MAAIPKAILLTKPRRDGIIFSALLPLNFLTPPITNRTKSSPNINKTKMILAENKANKNPAA